MQLYARFVNWQSNNSTIKQFQLNNKHLRYHIFQIIFMWCFQNEKKIEIIISTQTKRCKIQKLNLLFNFVAVVFRCIWKSFNGRYYIVKNMTFYWSIFQIIYIYIVICTPVILLYEITPTLVANDSLVIDIFKGVKDKISIQFMQCLYVIISSHIGSSLKKKWWK